MKQTLRSVFFLSLLTFLQSGFVKAQQKQFLKLDEAVQAVQHNKNVQIALTDEKIASAKYKQTDAVFLPALQFSYTALTTNNPLNVFGFKLQQKSVTAQDFNPDLLNHPAATPDFTTRLELQQPILNADMLFMRKAAQKQMDVYKYTTQRTKEHLVFEVQKAYLQLQYMYESKKVLDAALTTANAYAKLTENYFDQGLVQKSDLLNASVHVAGIQTNIAELNSHVQNISDYLSVLMGKTSGVTYLTDSFKIEIQDTAGLAGPNDNRSDFMAMGKAIESYDMMIQSGKMSYLPKLNAFGSYQMNDSRMMGFDANAYLAGIQLSWNLFNGFRTKNTIAQHNLEKQKLQQQLDVQKEQTELQLNQAKRTLEETTFKIRQYQASVQQAEESLRILSNRYTQGLIKYPDLQLAETNVMQQKLSLLNAKLQYHTAIYFIQFLTSSN